MKTSANKIPKKIVTLTTCNASKYYESHIKRGVIVLTDTQYALLYSDSPVNAHTALFNEYFNYVYSIVFNKLRSCGTKEDIEECVSDVFAVVFEKYEKAVSAAVRSMG